MDQQKIGKKLKFALEVLANVVRVYDRNTCTHDETHRGGVLWTICNSCGRKWADDEGGFKPYVDPEEIAEARILLNVYKVGQ